eukprot:TRINITY_DN12718_c0_g3_i2.p1 TRINITY_DN12718_c0_g3~~TRINITY_DN12718_c0_g3_i2.p1  ORF type:complete len:693 (+),score=82.23 TRINITY_DN12718_c0_g3_i2:134-2212(+)
MVFCNSRTHFPCQKALHLFQSAPTIVILSFLLPSSYSLHFDFSRFGPNTQNISYYGDAFSSNQVIELTKSQLDVPIDGSVGRAIYSQPVRLWDSQTQRLINFTTHFSFIIKALNSSSYGNGLAFFLAANGSFIPPASGSGEMGLFSSNSRTNATENQLVAVEFDSYMNEWDPSADHIGIDVNSIVSKANVTWRSSIKNGATANAWVSYESSTKNLSVFLTYDKNPIFGGNSSLYYIVDLSQVLPEWIYIGFSASTGRFVEIHQILSWDFNSTLEKITDGGRDHHSDRAPNRTGLAVGLVLVCGTVSIVGLGGLIWFGSRKCHACIDDEFIKGAGPKRFTYNELALATNNFSEDGKLGEGGFGCVYKGFLSELNSNVAVKRVSKGSKQGKKEFVSEVKIISQLRHRNLVQLLGLCHVRGDHFLLVYEFIPNGSLDSHLFRGKRLLRWSLRYKIAVGLASALLYLHEEWEQCVVHRDIKSSNVMLDSGFNAKLGDFGLGKLVDHELGLQTPVLAGTMDYLAPECVTTGKASKESDVYSFGVVALEIACGRRPVDPKAEANKVRMVEWVWELYGRGKLLDAADERLNNEFDEEQMERLMVMGLWCAHPDHNLRPSISQVINVLDLEAPLPSLPSKMPLAMYFTPTTNTRTFSYSPSATNGTSSNFTGSSDSSATALLHSRRTDVGIEFSTSIPPY